MPTIDITPTWGEFANLYTRFAESGEIKAIRHMRSELAKAMAAAQALQAISGTLTDAQETVVSRTMTAELAKQGY